METIKVSDDLLLEVHWEDDRPLLKLVSQSMQQDGAGGEVVIYPDEIVPLNRALLSAERILEEQGCELPWSGAMLTGKMKRNLEEATELLELIERNLQGVQSLISCVLIDAEMEEEDDEGEAREINT